MSVERFALWTCDNCGREERTVTYQTLPHEWTMQYDGTSMKHICENCKEDEE